MKSSGWDLKLCWALVDCHAQERYHQTQQLSSRPTKRHRCAASDRPDAQEWHHATVQQLLVQVRLGQHCARKQCGNRPGYEHIPRSDGQQVGAHRRCGPTDCLPCNRPHLDHPQQHTTQLCVSLQ
jgi:hypothetical protein